MKGGAKGGGLGAGPQGAGPAREARAVPKGAARAGWLCRAAFEVLLLQDTPGNCEFKGSSPPSWGNLPVRLELRGSPR